MVKRVELMRTRISSAGNRKSTRKSSGNKAFTLLELVVVIVITAIILGVTLPRFGTLLGGGELTRFTRSLTAYLRHARELSVVRNTPIKVAIDEELGRVYCLEKDESGASLAPVDVPETIQITLENDIGSVENDITFFPLGNATDSKILLVDDNGKIRLIEIVGMTGEIYIE
jgi:prepilin-type N-terminal cleavage/methylation domain-containing protein